MGNSEEEVMSGKDAKVGDKDGGSCRKQGGPFKSAAWELPQSPVGIPLKGL